ncbi:hypothetical protein [Candidatus Methylomirabilis sp.]|uniref:Uncharacterized protein n=1 Tax=Candidatus Methylomirabilis tolerans TaxID=3123416 RepID=A0AAJ1AL81_9BACT|nr:hypothetical protein [Candidatus Methylomirabilis sp.]
MAKQEKQMCPHRCPLCALYEAQEGFQQGVRECLPPEVSGHVNQAGRELLLAVRALLDRGLGAVASEPKPGSRRKAQKVKVE